MYNLIWADLFKLRRSLAIKILLGITTIGAVVMTVMAYLIPQGKVDASMTGIGFLFSDIHMMSILGAVLAGVFICGDFDNKTIHDAIASGSSRSTVIISKTLVFGCALVVLLLPYAIATGIGLGTGSEFDMGSMAVGFLHLLTSKVSTAFSAAVIGKLLVVMLTLLIVFVAQLSLCVPLALALKNPVLVVAIYYGFSLLCAQLVRLREAYPTFDRIFSYTPFGGNHSFVTLNTGAGDIIKAISVSLIFIIVMLAVTHFAFRKTEIK